MTSIDDLRRRAEAAENRFGAMHDRARDYSDRLLKVMTGVEGRMVEQSQHIAELEERLARSEAENEELRRMMHSLLMAIEGGNVSADEPERLGPALRDLETRVEQLMAPPTAPRPALAAAGGAGMMAAIAAIAAPTGEDADPPLELTADLIEHIEEEPESAPAPAAEPDLAWDLAPEQQAVPDTAMPGTAVPDTVDEDPLDLDMPAAAPVAAAEDRGFTFADDEPIAPAEDDFTFEAEDEAPAAAPAEPESLSPEDIAALLGSKPEPVAAPPADDAGNWDDDPLELDMAAAMAEPQPQPAPPPPAPGRPALSEADTALMNSIMATIQGNSAAVGRAPEPRAPEPVADPTAADDFDIDLDRLLSDAADDERARSQATTTRPIFDETLDIPEPARPNDAHAPDFDPEIDAILQHVRKGIAMPGSKT